VRTNVLNVQRGLQGSVKTSNATSVVMDTLNEPLRGGLFQELFGSLGGVLVAWLVPSVSDRTLRNGHAASSSDNRDIKDIVFVPRKRQPANSRNTIQGGADQVAAKSAVKPGLESPHLPAAAPLC
jgi:hypothetical protein